MLVTWSAILVGYMITLITLQGLSRSTVDMFKSDMAGDVEKKEGSGARDSQVRLMVKGLWGKMLGWYASHRIR